MDKEIMNEIEDVIEEDVIEEDYETQVKVQRQANMELINKFGDFLEESGLSDATINKHIRNVDFYVNTFLQYYDVQSIETGCYTLDEFLGDWFQRKAMWSTPTSTRENITSIKKFYSFLAGIGEVKKEDFEELNAEIKEFKQAWIDGTRYEELNRLYRFDDEINDDFDDDWDDEGDFFNSKLLANPEAIVKISHYLAAAVNLYGVINHEEFLDFYHYYEEDKITREDVLTVVDIIQDIIDRENIDYELHDDLIVHVSISPSEAPEEMKDLVVHEKILELQNETLERYFPPAQEVLNYCTSLYINPNHGINRLSKFIIRNRLFQPKKVDDNYTTLDFFLSEFSLVIKNGFPIETYPVILGNMLPQLHNLKHRLQEELEDIFIDIFNELRMWSIKAFNLNELDPEQPCDCPSCNLQHVKVEQRIVEKIGRNEPCPCGNGKKYKKCCERSHLTVIK